MRRFWDVAAAAPHGTGWAIALDGKPMRIPGGGELLVPTAALADAIAAEWQAAGGAKGGEMSLDDVPLTRLAGTAQDRVAPDPAAVADALAGYAETDLLCYRAGQPAPLARRQQEGWQPWRAGRGTAYGARLDSTAGILAVDQPAAALAAVRAALRAKPAPVLAALGLAVPALGSVVLGLAMADGALDAGEAHRLASLDELYQEEQWGIDDEAVRRRAAVAADVLLAGRFLQLVRP